MEREQHPTPRAIAVRLRNELFFSALFPRQSRGLVELRALPGANRTFLDPHAYRDIEHFINRNREKNIFVGFFTRIDSTSGARENCRELWTLWFYVDYKSIADAESRARLA